MIIIENVRYPVHPLHAQIVKNLSYVHLLLVEVVNIIMKEFALQNALLLIEIKGEIVNIGV